MKQLKHLVKSLLTTLHLDVTQGMRYDRQTLEVMKRLLKPSSNCVDIGANKGDMLALMKKFAPQGNLFAFEPLPHLYQALQEQYKGDIRVHISSIALSDKAGEAEFVHVVNAPDYSGFRQRTYSIAQPELQHIRVQTNTLDAVIPAEQAIDFLKIDVEGAELSVMRGALQTIRRYKPHLVFECGIGGSDHYGTTAADMYDFIIKECGLKLSTLSAFLKAKASLTAAEFAEHYRTNSEYYFIAHP